MYDSFTKERGRSMRITAMKVYGDRRILFETEFGRGIGIRKGN